MSELKPCPFCGTADPYTDNEGYVNCQNMDGCGAVVNSPTFWNTRAAQITPPAGEAEDGRYSLGLCADGCAILYDGVPVTVDDVIRRLNRTAPACADPECWQRPSPVAPVKRETPE